MTQEHTLAQAYREACELELRALKPGNVSVYASGHDMSVADFRLSAEVSAPFLADASLDPGLKVLRSIEATRACVGCNTNLGIVLLAAPLMHAWQTLRPEENLRSALRRVLAQTTQEDAVNVYRAIRLAAPAGLGTSPRADVADTPTITLLEAMTIAAQRDRVAYQYANAYADVFDFAIPRYHTACLRWGDDAWATAWVFIGILKRIPDSHLERKYGKRFSGMLAARMADLEDALYHSEKPEDVLARFLRVDSELKSNGLNPGTTADLTVACLLAARLEALLGHRKQEASALLRAAGIEAPDRS